jgi:hypothetical protein
MTRAWGGLVPDDTVGPNDARAEMAKAGGAPTGAEPGAATPPPPPDPALESVERSEQLLRDIRDVQAAANTPAKLRYITFTPHQLIVHDEQRPDALSVGVINPTSARVYVGLAGERAAPNSGAFVIPPASGMVIPVAVHRVEIGIDPTDLGENEARVFWLRFSAVQQFQFWAV